MYSLHRAFTSLYLLALRCSTIPGIDYREISKIANPPGNSCLVASEKEVLQSRVRVQRGFPREKYRRAHGRRTHVSGLSRSPFPFLPFLEKSHGEHSPRVPPSVTVSTYFAFIAAETCPAPGRKRRKVRREIEE